MTKIKVLDASAPPGLPSLLSGPSETTVMTAISALSFSPDGEVPIISNGPHICRVLFHSSSSFNDLPTNFCWNCHYIYLWILLENK